MIRTLTKFAIFLAIVAALAWGLASEPGTAMWDAFANSVHSRFDMIAVEFVQGIREHIVYLGKFIIGWTGWACLVALIYYGLEKLFPGFLCTAHHEG